MEMKGTSVKLVFLAVLLASVSSLAPFAVEGKHKKYASPPPPPPATLPPPPPPPPPDAIPPYQIHGCGYKCSDSNDCDAPCTVCCANMTCCYEVPMFP